MYLMVPFGNKVIVPFVGLVRIVGLFNGPSGSLSLPLTLIITESSSFTFMVSLTTIGFALI